MGAWSKKALRKHFRALMREVDKRNRERAKGQGKAVKAALRSAQEAVLKAEGASERRFESVNEFRAVLTDQAATFVTRSEAAEKEKAVELMQTRLTFIEGRDKGFSIGWAFVCSAVALVAGVLGTALLLQG